MIKYIITGGAGFIGSHLVEALIKKNKKVVVLDNLSTGRLANIKKFRNKIKFINCDLSLKGKWTKEFKGKCCVFHLASLADIVPSIQQPKKYFQSNVTGTLNVLEACRNATITKFLYSASSSCYGIAKSYPTPENEKINPMYPYALTKKLGEDLIIHWSKVYKIPFVSLRLFNVYGTRSRTSGTYGAMFGVFLAQKIKNKPLTVVGDGKQKRDFTYVSDIVNAFYKCIKYKGNIKIFNVGTGKPVSVNRIVNLLKCEKVNIPKRPGEPDQTNANITKIKKELKWKPTVTIEQGIKMLIDEIGYWRKAPLWTPKKIKLATKDWFKYLK